MHITPYSRNEVKFLLCEGTHLLHCFSFYVTWVRRALKKSSCASCSLTAAQVTHLKSPVLILRFIRNVIIIHVVIRALDLNGGLIGRFIEQTNGRWLRWLHWTNYLKGYKISKCH